VGLLLPGIIINICIFYPPYIKTIRKEDAMRAQFMHVGMEVETTTLVLHPANLGTIESDYKTNRAAHIPGRISEIPARFCGEVAYVYHPNGVPQKSGQGAVLAAYLFSELNPPEV
jgi:hypothetical protein